MLSMTVPGLSLPPEKKRLSDFHYDNLIVNMFNFVMHQAYDQCLRVDE